MPAPEDCGSRQHVVANGGDEEYIQSHQPQWQQQPRLLHRQARPTQQGAVGFLVAMREQVVPAEAVMEAGAEAGAIRLECQSAMGLVWGQLLSQRTRKKSTIMKCSTLSTTSLPACM
eukprot:TRINITY_DN68279_c0_g1_i1.p3 TRINITY_DN68279_c0_g1~~TRINITY_DN68279_c0_g1_i1.p3  ORF type:complete len:117 (-),score=6.54 TRINITY_DN68279_c0_g1_i1:29-379(-)